MTPVEVRDAVIELRETSYTGIRLREMMEMADAYGIDAVGRVMNEAQFHAAALLLAQRVWRLSHAAEGHCRYDD